MQKIERLASAEAVTILEKFNSKRNSSFPISYDKNGVMCGDFNTHFTHRGIYGFRVEKAGKSAVVYIGKAENNKRLRQHLLSQNKDGSPLAESVRTKHNKIKYFISNGYKVALCLYSNPTFAKASLSCIEIATALKAKEEFKILFPKVAHWNVRIG
ncbi:MAG TPA: hypothetical protein HPP97_10260 [Desulfuromonadales bacterium]|nr:hypothetical protein [Desulfuromonadales bacterium]